MPVVGQGHPPSSCLALGAGVEAGIMKDRRGKTVKPRRRNPVARALRDVLYRARREANRRRYSRKLKHRDAPETDPE
jgi:hypothetical protein